ncbi:siderophore-interacting protein [Arthrobacter sp. Br18]|uniref:siderophore-interacting protein n=1 Tax=Arthrobacter sp. Br18 TaxID=1312954 RepID=UPI0006874FE5|nr:siderophore-interacting protein [Arthrobacter sp. Br18]
MSAAALTPAHPVRVFDVIVRRVQDLTPHFRRITFTGPALDRFGVPGPTLDLRIKMLLSVPGQTLSRPGPPDGQLREGWYRNWLQKEQPGRGWIRSYTVRALRATAHCRELDVDFVIHPAADGHGAPASDWARAAAPGTGAVIIGPDAEAITAATGLSETGIRWNPQGARQILLAGDETAVPAISSILEALPAHVTGHAFLEVPDGSDFQDISTDSGVQISWLARHPTGALRGELLYGAVRAKRQVNTATQENTHAMYAWVAGEAGTVKSLRRYLVNQLGLDPRQSEFRAYWSLGKSGSGTNGTPNAGNLHPGFRGATGATVSPVDNANAVALGN